MNIDVRNTTIMDSHPPVDAQDNAEQTVTDLPDVDAAHVYVLMKKNTRVSRNIRACWFFRHLRRKVSFTPLTSVEGLTEELTLVSVVPKDSEVQLLDGQTYQVCVCPDTIVTFLSSQYRLSFTLDLSPSVMSVDVQNGSYVFEGIFQSLSRCLRGLVMPLVIPGSSIRYSPELYISVICHTPVVCSSTNQVLVQGVKINQDNIDHYLRHIEFELIQFEAALSSSFATLLKLYRRQQSFFLDEDEEEGGDNEFNLTDHIGNPEAGFTNMLRYGILALQLLPDNSSSGIIVITDGIVGLPNSYLIELLLNQMRTYTTMCSFIKVGSPSGLYRKLAHVPHIELMQAIATATFGAYLGAGPDVSEEKGEANLYHRAMLFWSFQRGLEGFDYEITHLCDEDLPGSISWIKKMLHRHPITGETFGLENMRKEREKRTVLAGLHSVLSVRLREGYTIKSVSFKKDNTEIHVRLHFPWRDYGKIEYAASAAWPLTSSSPVTNIEVTVEGSYDLLHEMLCKPSTEVKSTLRMNNIKTLWTILERIASTDKMLEHLQSFSSEPTYYQTPESILSGVPLFYIQPEGPSINMQLKAGTMDRFAAFWKQVILLDTNNWQKWLHSHRICLVLEHDRHFPKCFQVPNASSRFTSIQCRQAMASLSLLLREWSTFVLAENHSYIKFIQHDQDKPPKFFCALRLTSKAPNMIIRMGFLGGTPATIRLEELHNLREKIRDLHFPQRGTQKTHRKGTPGSSSGGQEEKQKPYKCPLSREGSEISCCILLRKPVEKILVVYETKPRDMTVVKESLREVTGRKPQDPMRSVFRTLTHYLQHQRWVWNVQANEKSNMSMVSLSRMLATLTKLRLQEGFHFAVSGSGITNLVLEVDMKIDQAESDEDPSNIQACVVQYIIFPPHVKSNDDSLSDDDQDDTVTTESDGEVQLVTECWVEPQYGVCCNNTPERQHFNGLTYLDIAKAFYPYDYECVSSLTTFEHLVYLCENSAIPSPDVVASRQSSPPSTPGNPFVGKREESFRSEPTVNFISFPFDLQSILPRSQQAELLFSTFIIGDGSRVSQDVVLDPKEPNELLLSLFFEKLKGSHNNEILVSADDCYRFTQHVLHRSRDHVRYPVPFTYRTDGIPFREGTFAFEHGTLFETDHDGTDASSTSTRRNPDTRRKRAGDHITPRAGRKDADAPRTAPHDATSKHLYNKFTQVPQSTPAADTGAKVPGNYPNSSNRSETKPGPKVLQRSESFHCPMWKCYVKKDITDHLLLTFVPASFDDLLLLNPSLSDTSPEEISGDSLPHIPAPTSEEKIQLKDASSPGHQTTAKDETGSQQKSSSTQVYGDPLVTDATSKNEDEENISNLSPNRETRNEKVQQWVNTSTHSMKPSISGPLLIPVYVYSCELKNLTNSLVDRWTFSLPEDIFEDMSFKKDPSDEVRSPRSPRSQLQSFDENTDDQDDRDSWRSSLDRRSTDSNSHRIDSFKEHCKSLTEMYFNSFVLGVFLSLRQSYFVDSQDVDSAINNICEESHPLETDMTTYLLASCSHLLHMVQKARLREKCGGEGGLRPGPAYHKQVSVRFQDIIDIHKEDEAPRIPEVLQMPNQSLDITEDEWSSLSPDQCQQLKEHHQLCETIKAKFAEAIGQCLHPVPSLPDFYFYCPNVVPMSSADGLDDKDDDFEENEEGNVGDGEGNVSQEEDIIMTRQDDRGELSVGTSMESNHDDSSIGSFEGNISNNSVDNDPMPLFVHFTCTVKQKSNFQHTSLRTVPQCFGQIVKGLSEPFQTIDFSDFKVTFDINCLTLLSDVEQPMPRKPSYLRLLSNMSQTSAAGKEEAEEKNSTIIGSPKPLGDPVSHLPRLQHSAVYAVKDEIESLMQEEVISALRHMHPISADTLVFVAEYIRNTAHFLSRTVRYQPVNLQFVYGADQSLNMFIEEFERQNLPGYRLTKEGDFYFLIVNKAHMRYTPFEIVAASHGGLDAEGKMVISKDERSFSLPCVFPDPLDRVDVPAGSRSLIDMVEDTTSSEAGDGKVRPRSCSDAKATQKARCHRGHVDIKAMMSSPEASNQGGTLLQDFKISEEDRQVEQSLKKSSSFAGLQGRSPGINATGGSRSRHCSAPSGHISVASHSSTMPQSPSVISSRESTTEDGFDGDVSDMELDESASMSDISGCYPELPDFWLLMQIYQERVEVFFHSREPLDSESPTRAAHQAVYDATINNIQSVCQKVNQALLLKELNKTKTCNALLVPEADEDFKWTNKRSGRAVNDGYEMDEEEDSEEGQGYLAAVMDFVPGHFACDIVWQNKFALHPRLKHVVHRGSPPLGVLVIRQVLNNFIVTNRKNMFVIQELTSRNVFYLRLKEIQVAQDSDVELDSSASDLSHVNQSRQPQSKGDSDSVSLTSSLGRQYSKVEEVVELTVHGIEEVGQEIKDDLMKMLQNKLDDALLDAICVMLSRNPQCKLKPDDISFIQRAHQAPVESLHLNIPGHCSMYLVALMYYLRQNLLQFLHTPNYIETNPACQFKDVYDGVCTAIPSDKVYLYVRPQPGGGKGIACVGVNLVDGQGKQVKLLNCPCPTKNNMPSLSDPSEFDKYVQTTIHEKSTSSRPGPTALIQFRIWECGNSDLRVLCDRLMAAVRHALCDIVMECFMLTSPICSVPRNLMDSYGAPVSSLPASPTKLPPEGLERKHNPLSRKFSIDPPRSVTHSVSMFSSFGELRGNILDTVGKCIDFNTVPTSSDQPRTPASGQTIQSRPKDTPMSDARLQQLTISKYESGEKGNLHQVFCSLMKPWLDFCHSIGVPSVVSTKVQFQSRFSVDFVMKELQQSIPNISNDTALRVFKVIQTSSPTQPPYGVLFTPCKATLKDLQMSRVLDSLAASGGKVTMMAIGRSMDQWHSTVQEDQNIMPNLSAAAIRGYRASQKFLPQVLAEGESKNLDQTSLRSAEKDFVPRQRLLIMVCEGKEMTLVMYNWSNDMVGTIEKTATRLVQWHNARSHVLHSVLAQKMGLFHHFQFSDLQYTPTQNPFTHSTAEVDSLIRHHAPSRDYQRRNSSISNKDRDKTTSRSLKRIIPFDQTYKNMRPPKLMEKLMCSVLSDPVNRHGSHAQELRMHARQDKQLSQQQSLGGASRKDFSDDKIPVCSIKDPVFQQGLHLTDAQKSFVEGEERNKLYQLYLGWLQTSGKNKANPAVMEDYLMQLKRACRLFHYCATPLVFSTSWRQSVVQKTTGKGDKLRQDVGAFNFSGTTSANTTAAQALMTSAATTPATPDRTQKTFAHFLPVPSPVSRSRHSSGTSNISFKGKPSEEPGRKGSEAGLILAGAATTGLGRSKSDAEEEEQWHIDLRRKFLMEYEQYLGSELSFTRVNLQPPMFKGRSQGSTLSNQGSTESSSEGKPGTINLQKTLTGGIIVMEMSFRQEFFCVKMFAIDCCQFKINANQQMHLIFVDECDKYKDLIHVHSFAHDFHLRSVQSYLNSPLDSVFPASFNLDSFLTEFKQIYPYPPSFSRNCVQQDSITLPELPFPGEMLYDCMLKQRGAPHDMTVYRMVGSVDGHQVCEKFSLVSHEKLELSNLTHSTEEDQPEKPETYDAGIVIIDNTVRGEGQNDSMKLVLKYFTVLTRERDCYPIHTLEKVLGESKGLLASTEEKTNRELRCDKDQDDLSKPVAVRQHICMRKEHVNYRGYSNMQQLALFAALGRQSERGKDKILEMIDMSKKKCRRNYLWQRLLTSRNQADDGKKKRVELEETGDSVLIPLSSLDFCELLQSVVMIPLNEVDPQLDPLFNMPYSWYHGLYTALINKYPGSHCCYSSPNRKTKYIVVFNANNLNMFAMLSLTDSTEQMELCVVMKDKVLDSMKHSPNTPNLPLYSLQTHVEDLVNVCSYQVWASMVQ